MTITSTDHPITGRTADLAADKAKDVIDKTASWASQAAGDSDVGRRIEPLADAAKRTVDAASSALKQTADTAWDAAQKTRDHAADMARDVYQRSQKLGAEVIRQTQDQPVTSILIALSAGIVVGFSLSMMLRSR